MTAISDRLARGLRAARDGDLDTARQILDEVSHTDDDLAPVPGLDPSTQARYFQLLGDVLDGEGDEDDDLIDAAYQRMEDLDTQARALGLEADDDDDAPRRNLDEPSWAEESPAEPQPLEPEVLEPTRREPVPVDPDQPNHHEERHWASVALQVQQPDGHLQAALHLEATRVIQRAGPHHVTQVVDEVETWESAVVLADPAEPTEDDPGGWRQRRVESLTLTRTTYLYDTRDSLPDEITDALALTDEDRALLAELDDLELDADLDA